MLTLKSLPEISGEGYYWSNDGSLENVGLDFGVRFKLLNRKNWKWELGANASAYKNEITALPDGDYTTQIYGANVLTSVGRAAGVFYGYETDGVYATQQEADEAGLTLVAATGEVTPFGAGDMKFVDHVADGGSIYFTQGYLAQTHPHSDHKQRQVVEQRTEDDQHADGGKHDEVIELDGLLFVEVGIMKLG